jgi:hypothetical protein
MPGRNWYFYEHLRKVLYVESARVGLFEKGESAMKMAILM